MHGTLLDQRVFEALVARCLPMIHNHFEMVDVQLSVPLLPWFLSLYVKLRSFRDPVIEVSHISTVCLLCIPDSGLVLLHGNELFQVGRVTFSMLNSSY